EVGRANVARACSAEAEEIEYLPVRADLPGLDLATVAVVGDADCTIEFGALRERQVPGDGKGEFEETLFHVEALLAADDTAARAGEEVVRHRDGVVEGVDTVATVFDARGQGEGARPQVYHVTPQGERS